MKYPDVARSRRASLTSKIIRSCSSLFLLLAAPLSPTLLPAMALRALHRQEARVEGIVRDSQGKAVAGASVLLKGDSQSSSGRTQTDTDGTFVFLSIRAGTYTVKVEKSLPLRNLWVSQESSVRRNRGWGLDLL